jgi:hypothetical protein
MRIATGNVVYCTGALNELVKTVDKHKKLDDQGMEL